MSHEGSFSGSGSPSRNFASFGFCQNVASAGASPDAAKRKSRMDLRTSASQLRLGDARLLEVQDVEEVVGEDLLEERRRRQRRPRRVRHAQRGDGGKALWIEQRAVPRDRRAPVVADDDGGALAERIEHADGIRRVVLHRVCVDGLGGVACGRSRGRPARRRDSPPRRARGAGDARSTTTPGSRGSAARAGPGRASAMCILMPFVSMVRWVISGMASFRKRRRLLRR